MQAPPFRDLLALAFALAERHPDHQDDARQAILDLRKLYPAGSTNAPFPTHRVIYLHHLSTETDRASRERVDWFAAYELTAAGLTPVWPDYDDEGEPGAVPPGMVYRDEPKSVPSWAFRKQGGNYDKPHEIARDLSSFWGEPVAYRLLTGFHPHLDTTTPNK